MSSRSFAGTKDSNATEREPCFKKLSALRVVPSLLLVCGLVVLFQLIGLTRLQNNSAFGGGEVPGLNIPRETPITTGKGFDLAKEQSFGFFTDISDDNWEISQRLAARTFPNHFGNDLNKFSNGPGSKGKVKQLGGSKNWNGRNFQEEFHCAHAQRIPTTSEPDGPKWVCDPHRIAAQKDGCLVYSVGSNGNVDFERGIHDEISPDCEVHTFDVIDSNKRGGRHLNFTTALKDYSTFHHWGIGTKEEAQKHKYMKTLNQTMEALGHIGRRIDIFKIDCEWCEWFTYKEWMEVGDLRQILVETHNAPMPNAKDFFYTLHDNGYVIFSKEANYVNGAGGVEFAFIKLETSFFINGTLYNSITGS